MNYNSKYTYTLHSKGNIYETHFEETFIPKQIKQIKTTTKTNKTKKKKFAVNEIWNEEIERLLSRTSTERTLRNSCGGHAENCGFMLMTLFNFHRSKKDCSIQSARVISPFHQSIADNLFRRNKKKSINKITRKIDWDWIEVD